MKVGIIGSGIVGRVLASAFVKEGNDVMLGTRDLSKPEVLKWAAENPDGITGSFMETAAFGDILVLATSGKVTLEVVNMAGIENFTGKTVIDATNPIDTAPPVNGVLQFFTTHGKSLMEMIQDLIPEANLVKAFSSVGNAFMYKPDFNGIKPTMFICGNNENSKQTVIGMLDAFGWDTEDMGKAQAAGPIESLCILWCLPGFLRNQWGHAFKLLKK